MKRLLWTIAAMMTAVAVTTTSVPVGAKTLRGTTPQPREAVQIRYTVTDIPTLGGTFSGPSNLTNNAQIVGVSTFAGDSTEGAFRWLNGKTTGLPSLGGPQSGAGGINASGEISGWADTTKQAPLSSVFNNASDFCNPPAPGRPELVCRAVVWRHGKPIDLGTLGGANSAGARYGLNHKGQVVGAAETKKIDPTSALGWREYHAFLWQPSNSKMIDLGTLGGPNSWAGGINASGQVVGTSTVDNLGSPPHAFLRDPGKKMKDLGALGGSYGGATAIDKRGQVVGYAALAGDTTTHAFLWWPGHKMKDLGTLSGYADSGANGVTDGGRVFGSACTNASVCRAFMWNKGKMIDLNTLLPQKSGWQLTEASTGNAKGQIIGTGMHKGKVHGFLLTPVPAKWQK